MLREKREEVEHWQEQQGKCPQGKATTGRTPGERLLWEGFLRTGKREGSQRNHRAAQQAALKFTRNKQTKKPQSPHILSEPNISGRWGNPWCLKILSCGDVLLCITLQMAGILWQAGTSDHRLLLKLIPSANSSGATCVPGLKKKPPQLWPSKQPQQEPFVHTTQTKSQLAQWQQAAEAHPQNHKVITDLLSVLVSQSPDIQENNQDQCTSFFQCAFTSTRKTQIFATHAFRSSTDEVAQWPSANPPG